MDRSLESVDVIAAGREAVERECWTRGGMDGHWRNVLRGVKVRHHVDGVIGLLAGQEDGERSWQGEGQCRAIVPQGELHGRRGSGEAQDERLTGKIDAACRE